MLKRRYFIIVFIVITIGCGYAFYSVYQSVKTATIKQINEQQMIYAKITAQGIESLFIKYNESLKIFSGDNCIINLSKDGKELLETFYKLHSKEIKSINRVDANGYLIYTYPETEFIGLNISKQPIFQEAKKTLQSSVSDVFISKRDYKVIVSQVPIIKNGMFDGYISVFINFEAIAKNYLENIKIGNDGYALTISKKGEILYTPNTKNIGKNALEIASISPSLIKMFHSMLEGKEGITTYEWDFIRGEPTGTVTNHAVYYPIKIDNTFWSIAVTTPEKEVFSDMEDFRQKSVLIVLVFIIGIVAFTYSQFNYLSILKEDKIRKESEKSIKKSEAEKSIILNHMTDLVSYQDIENRIIWGNKAIADAYNTTTDKISGHACYEIFQHLDKPCDGCPVVKAIQTGEIQENEMTIPDGRIWMIRGIPVKDDKNILIGVVEISTEITEKKKLENQLLQAQKMETIGTLAGGIAHDFNNILGIIMGYSEILLMKFNKDAIEYSNIEQIRKASYRAKDLVQQILLFSRKSDTEYKPLNYVILLQESIKMLRTMIPTTVDIKTEINLSDINILADPTQMHQVIMNLASNAAHAMQEHGGTLTFNLSKVIIIDNGMAPHQDLIPGEYLKLSVSDTGHGINKNVINRIFDPFFTTKIVGEGTGMGLSVVHGIVKNHKGAITVYSEDNKGTVFHVYLPVAESDVNTTGEISADILKGTENILIVDDEEVLVNLGQTMIETLGYKVVAESSSVNALITFTKNPDQFDLILTDYAMPHLSGLDLAKEILTIRKDIPIILVTGFGDVVMREKANNIGIKAMVTKPLSINEISVKIRKVLDNKSD